MQTEAATFVVFDTETTGVLPRADRVIEIGAVKMRGTEIVERFSSLVNPERVVPRRITDITGISTGTLVGAPLAADVLPRFAAFAGDAVLVGHNIAFDVGFVNAELERLNLPALANPTLCTVRLARRLLPGLKSKGLSSVTEHLGIRVVGRHRAAGDAEATAEVLRIFVGRLGLRARTVEGLLSAQHSKYQEHRAEPGHLTRVRELVATMPDRPGVYFMHDGAGATVYVGKAKRLRTRVRSYFTAIEAKEPRLRQLLETVRKVTWEETGSELGALLLESRLIKELQPRFNRASRRYRSRPFLRLETDGPFPRVALSYFTLDDGAEYFGPLGGRRQAEVVVEVINRFFRLRECDAAGFARGKCLYADLGRCLAPCATGDSEAYTDEVGRVRGFLLGRDPAVLDAIRASMMEAAGRREYELAGTYRDWLKSLEGMAGKHRTVAASVLDHNAVVVQDAAAPGTLQLFVIRYGRLADTLTVAHAPDDAAFADLEAALARHFGPDAPRPERYHKREIDEVRLLAHFLYVYRESARQVRFEPGMSVGAFTADVRSALGAREDAEAFEEV